MAKFLVFCLPLGIGFLIVVYRFFLFGHFLLKGFHLVILFLSISGTRGMHPFLYAALANKLALEFLKVAEHHGINLIAEGKADVCHFLSSPLIKVILVLLKAVVLFGELLHVGKTRMIFIP